VSTPVLRAAHLDELTPLLLHDLLRLRVDVFVVEQQCPYAEIDGRDAEPTTWHLWHEVDGRVLSTVRLLQDADGARVGRVATSAAARGQGLAARLVRHAVALAGPQPVRLDAQAHLRGWYERLGFAVTGPEFVEDGISHVPMRLPSA
jgi:predicted GNAT family N-acyltransferase